MLFLNLCMCAVLGIDKLMNDSMTIYQIVTELSYHDNKLVWRKEGQEVTSQISTF